MPWFKVDDKLHDHRKSRRAGKSAMGLWVLAGSWAAANLTDGFVPADMIRRWGTLADARRLADVGLWCTDELDGEKGWRFHDWLDHQPDARTVRLKQEAESKGGTLGNHTRWHARRKVKDPECPFCNQVPDQGPDRGGESGTSIAPESPVPSRPVPSRPLSVVTSSSQSSNATRGLGEDGLTRIEQATKGPRSHALKVADHVLTRSNGDVRDPLRYVLKAIETEPENYRFRRGNPTKATECPDHPGEWADACRIHRSEDGA